MNSVVPRMRADAKGGESGRLRADHLTSERWWGGGGGIWYRDEFFFFFSNPFVNKEFFFSRHVCA